MKKALGKLFLRMGERMALGYDAGDSRRQRRDLGWDRRNPSDEDSLVGPDGTLKLMRQKCADLRRNDPIVAGMCERIAAFTVATGITPQARTTDDDFNSEAEDYFTQWFNAPDSRRRVSGWQLQHMAVSLRPTHGGLYLEWTEDGHVRPIETERIFNPSNAAQAKAYTNGVRINRRTGQVEGYWVHSRDDKGGFTRRHEERFVKSESIIPVIRAPWRPDQVREIPDLAPVVNTLKDVSEMNTHTLNTAKTQSKIIGQHLTRDGQGGINSGPRGSQPAPSVGKRKVWETDWGVFFQGFPGDELDLKTSPTPGTHHIPYMKLELMIAASAMNFPYEFFTLDFSTADFSRMTAVLMLVNMTIRGWQKWLNSTMNQRLWNRIILKGIRDGAIRPAPKLNGISQWSQVEWQPAEEPWIDRQEAQQADIMEVQACLGTLTKAAKRRGCDLETNVRQRIRETKMILTECEKEKIDPNLIFQMQIPGQQQTPMRQKAETDAMKKGA